jgi:hypothetical protein
MAKKETLASKNWRKFLWLREMRGQPPLVGRGWPWVGTEWGTAEAEGGGDAGLWSGWPVEGPAEPPTGESTLSACRFPGWGPTQDPAEHNCDENGNYGPMIRPSFGPGQAPPIGAGPARRQVGSDFCSTLSLLTTTPN